LNQTLTGIWNLESNQETSATCLDLLDEHQKYQEIQETSQRRGFSRPAERRILTDPILSFCLKFCFNNIQYTHMDRSFLTEFYDVFYLPLSKFDYAEMVSMVNERIQVNFLSSSSHC